MPSLPALVLQIRRSSLENRVHYGCLGACRGASPGHRSTLRRLWGV